MLNLENIPGQFYVQTHHSDDNADFVNRQKSVFEKLDAVVKDKEKSFFKVNSNKRKTSSEEAKLIKKQKCDTRQFRGQESIFKRPEAPPPARFKKNIPDYLRNPQNWTKYTLSDVSQEDMSDRSNTAAAMSFLRELKIKKEAESMEIDNDSGQVTFKKPLRKQDGVANNFNYESPNFRSSKVIMPEYVVGDKKIVKKSQSRKTEKAEKCTEIKLDHLLEEDEEFE